ncbi:MAG: NAD-dependent epimerase/dehydratase family protein [Anaerolineaceae bacterium]
MNIFVTGGTGFIGKHLVKRLANSPHHVRCLVRRPEAAANMRRLGLDPVPGDVTDLDSLRAGMSGCDVVMNLANLYSMWLPDAADFRRVNVDGTRNLMQAAVETQAKRVVHVSTVAVYGKPADTPFNEDSTPGARLFSEYARTKAEGDQIANDFASRGLPLVTLQPGIVLGGGDDKASGIYIKTLINRDTPSTLFHRSTATYVYVEDVVDAILAAAEKPGIENSHYLLGGTTLDGLDYARLICKTAGVSMPSFNLPAFTIFGAALGLTALSSILHQFPRWGLSLDAARTMYNGFNFDGSKAERELGVHYTSIQKALTEAIASYRSSDSVKNAVE